MKPHFETSPATPEPRYCTCPIGYDHTVAEFYAYVDQNEMHPVGQAMLNESARQLREGQRR